MRPFVLFVLLFLFSIIIAANQTYQQDGSPTLVNGTNPTDISYINVDDISYYNVSAIFSGTLTSNETADSGDNTCDTTAAGSYVNTTTNDTTYWQINAAGSCGIGIPSNRKGWNSSVNMTNVAYSASEVSSITWYVKFYQSSGTPVSSVQIYNYTSGAWDNLTTGRSPTTDTEYSGTITSGIANLISSGKEMRMKIVATTGGTGSPILYWNWAMYKLTKKTSYDVNVEHSSTAAPQPSGTTLKEVYVSDKFATNATATYFVDIFNWGSSLWENCQNSSVSAGADTTWTCTKTTGPTNYINATTNKIKMRTTSNSTSQFQSKENYLFYRIKYPWLSYVNISAPLADPNLCSTDAGSCSFTMTCNYSCDSDYACTSVNVYAQYKPLSGNWKDIDATTTDNLTLNGTETNPHTFASVPAGTTNAQTSFGIKGNGASSGNLIRCRSTSSDAGSLNGTVTTAITVNTFVDTSISPGSISFGSLDPATNEAAATNNPTQVTVTPNTNTNVDTYIGGTDLTGPDTIVVGNLKVSKTSGGAKTSLTTSFPGTPYYSNAAPNTLENYYFYLTVPSGQTAGGYTGTVTIKTGQAGFIP
jgi:hypothetical protein